MRMERCIFARKRLTVRLTVGLIRTLANGSFPRVGTDVGRAVWTFYQHAFVNETPRQDRGFFSAFDRCRG
jgi:hypothetical protein